MTKYVEIILNLDFGFDRSTTLFLIWSRSLVSVKNKIQFHNQCIAKRYQDAVQ